MMLLDVYLSGSLLTTIALALVAVKMQKSHGMRPATIVLLTVPAGVIWPLLAFATLQILAFMAFAIGVRTVRPHSSRAARVAVDPAPVGLAEAA
jgi:hypothetical protein